MDTQKEIRLLTQTKLWMTIRTLESLWRHQQQTGYPIAVDTNEITHEYLGECTAPLPDQIALLRQMITAEFIADYQVRFQKPPFKSP